MFRISLIPFANITSPSFGRWKKFF
jgi:hypothetical protein